MNSRGFWKTALKIAWRESRGSSTKFLFVIFAVAVGVGSLTGVRGFSEVLARMLKREARTLMAADAYVRLLGVPTQPQLDVISNLEKRGVQATRVTETLSMVTSRTMDIPAPVSVKSVDPALYPFYGTVTLSPPGKLSDALRDDTTVVSDDLRVRLKVEIGDTVRVGGEDFRIAAILVSEPDRLSSGPAIGPRVMLTRAGLERTQLIQLGSRAPQRILLKLNDAIAIPVVREQLKKAFPDDAIFDYTESNQNVTRSLEFATGFLSLVSMIALIVGGVGVATAMHAHLIQKMDSIAIMKSMGARSSQVVSIYVFQTILLGLAGGALGVVMGSGVQHLFPPILSRFFQVQVDVPWLPSSAAQGILTGLLVTLLFTLPPLLSIQKIRPLIILRRAMTESARDWRSRLTDSRNGLLAGMLVIAGLAGIAVWLIGGTREQAVRVGSIFTGGLLGSLLALAGVAWVLLRLLRFFVTSFPLKLPSTLRHGMANIYRPGSQSESVLTALGVGVMFTLTIYLVQVSVLTELNRSAPPGMSNVFLLDITDQQHTAVDQMLRTQPGVEHAPEIIGTVSSRLTAIDGIPMDQYKVEGKNRRFAGRRVLTWSQNLPNGASVVQGAWWKGTPATPQVAVVDWIAKSLNLHVGSTMDFDAFGHPIRAKVCAIHHMDPHRIGARIEFIFSPGVLEKLPSVYYGAARVRPDSVAALQRVSFARFPTVTVINLADIMNRVQEVVNQVGFIIRFISLFAILAGATILASSVAGTRFRRMREVVIFKTLGATRGRIAAIFSAEFLILGIVAGLMGSLLATVFSMVVMKELIKADFHFNLMPNLIAVLLTALIAVAAGWVASFRILGQKPLEILRSE